MIMALLSAPHPQSQQYEAHIITTLLSRTAFKILNPNSTPLSLVHLTAPDISLYTRIISLHPPSNMPVPTSSRSLSHTYRTRALITSLPPHLKNPTPVLLKPMSQERLSEKFSKVGCGVALPPPAKLCKLHECLNAQVVASVMGWLETEIEDHLPEMLERVTGGRAGLSSKAAALVRTVEDVMGARLAPEEFRYWCKRAPRAKWMSCLEKHCDACMLSHVGSDVNVLVGLHALILIRVPQRLHSQCGSRSWLRWVEGWIVNHGVDGPSMLQRSRKVAAELREAMGMRSDLVVACKPAPMEETEALQQRGLILSKAAWMMEERQSASTDIGAARLEPVTSTSLNEHALQLNASDCTNTESSRFATDCKSFSEEAFSCKQSATSSLDLPITPPATPPLPIKSTLRSDIAAKSIGYASHKLRTPPSPPLSPPTPQMNDIVKSSRFPPTSLSENVLPSASGGNPPMVRYERKPVISVW